jgi:hypothetical protein
VLEKPAPMPNLDTFVATDEQISAYLLKQKKMKASIKREQMSNLFKKALPPINIIYKINYFCNYLQLLKWRRMNNKQKC